jgi:hypothetical protein
MTPSRRIIAARRAREAGKSIEDYVLSTDDTAAARTAQRIRR